MENSTPLDMCGIQPFIGSKRMPKFVHPAMLSIGQRIKAKRKDKGWTQKELGERAGRDQQIVASYEKGHSKHPRYLEDIASALGCHIDELKQGEFPHLKKAKGTSLVKPTTKQLVAPAHREMVLPMPGTREPSDTVPLVGVARAGSWIEPDTLSSIMEVPRDRDLDWDGNVYALRVEGKSTDLVPIPDGSVVFCAPYFEYRAAYRSRRDIVHAVLRRGQLEEWTIKELVVGNDGVIELRPRSSDPQFKPFRFDPRDAGDTQLEIRGIVLKVHLDLRH